MNVIDFKLPPRNEPAAADAFMERLMVAAIALQDASVTLNDSNIPQSIKLSSMLHLQIITENLSNLAKNYHTSQSSKDDLSDR